MPLLQWLKAWFDRNTKAGGRPNLDDEMNVLYLGSFLSMRVAIGVVGFLIPPALCIWNGVFTGEWVRSSISQFYHSGARDILVGGLWVIAFFLITYKIFERNSDNTLSIAAGVAALGVATFPTNIDQDELCGTADAPDATGCVRETAFLLKVLGDDPGQWNWVMITHLVCAAVFFVCMAVLSFLFGGREGNRTERPGCDTTTPAGRAELARANRKWRRIHYGLGLAIIPGAPAWILLLEQAGSGHAALVGEWWGIWAFAISWVLKGWEREYLRAARRAGRARFSTREREAELTARQG